MANLLVQKWPKSGEYTDLNLVVVIVGDTFEGFSPDKADPKHGVFFNNPTGGPLDITFNWYDSGRETPLDPEGLVRRSQYGFSLAAGAQRSIRVDNIMHTTGGRYSLGSGIGVGLEAANVMFPIDANSFDGPSGDYYRKRR